MKLTSCLLAAALATSTVELIPASSARAETLLSQATEAPRTGLSPRQATEAATALLQAISTQSAAADTGCPLVMPYMDPTRANKARSSLRRGAWRVSGVQPCGIGVK